MTNENTPTDTRLHWRVTGSIVPFCGVRYASRRQSAYLYQFPAAFDSSADSCAECRAFWERWSTDYATEAQKAAYFTQILLHEQDLDLIDADLEEKLTHMTITYNRVTRISKADFAVCTECSHVIDPSSHEHLSSTVLLHFNGTGHRKFHWFRLYDSTANGPRTSEEARQRF